MLIVSQAYPFILGLYSVVYISCMVCMLLRRSGVYAVRTHVVTAGFPCHKKKKPKKESQLTSMFNICTKQRCASPVFTL